MLAGQDGYSRLARPRWRASRSPSSPRRTAPYPAAITALTGAGATTVDQDDRHAAPNTPSIVTRAFEKDLNAYLGGTSGGAGSLQGIVNYNTANPVEGLKYQQGQLTGGASPDLSALAADTRRGQGGERRGHRRAADATPT